MLLKSVIVEVVLLKVVIVAAVPTRLKIVATPVTLILRPVNSSNTKSSVT